MKPGGRLQAAIEILTEIGERHRPAALALGDWGRAHRFAGSSDRAAIGNLVFDILRRRASLAAIMGNDSPRALAIAAMAFLWDEGAEGVARICDGSTHAPQPPSEAERTALSRPLDETAPAWVAGDFPEWLGPSFERVFGDRAQAEGAGLARRAPIDLRVNTLKTARDKARTALRKFNVSATPLSPVGLRIAPPTKAGKSPKVEADPSHGRGHFELQDEGSQIAALLVGAEAGMQVLDLCAGSGGKTLALAAQMQNKGQIHANDTNAHRLRPIVERLKRAGVRNAQVIPAGETAKLDALTGRMDRVVVDAPCTGSGVWRRRPDAKWRLSQAALADRIAEQTEILDHAAGFVKPGGRLVYITCSVLAEENTDQVEAVLARQGEFVKVPVSGAWAETLGSDYPAPADGATETLLLTPQSHGTDGFFIAILERK